MGRLRNIPAIRLACLREQYRVVGGIDRREARNHQRLERRRQLRLDCVGHQGAAQALDDIVRNRR